MNSCYCPTPSETANALTEQAFERPRVHKTEDENGVRLQVALPGVRKEDVKLTLHESNLGLSADRSEQLPENCKVLHESNSTRRYGLDVRFGAKLDVTQTRASFENGVLTLQVPIREEAKPRQIQIT